MDRPDPTVRAATSDDHSEIIEVAAAALGWYASDPNEAFFRWKHLDNPSGPSPMWVAVEDGAIVGFRTMMRWTFSSGTGSRSAVRAVDTATHPDHHRRGIFTLLTEAAIAELTDAGVSFVFNTPNDKSRPGYLRMGWDEAGVLAARFRVRRPVGAIRMLGARTAAAKWSERISAGDTIDAALDDVAALAASTSPEGIHTDRTGEHLLWRYGFEPLAYRVIRTDDAAAIVRSRRRGSATETVVAELFAGDDTAARGLLARVGRECGGDYALMVGSGVHPTPGTLTAPGLGPTLTLRDLADPHPTPDELCFSLGDIELF